ncbi:4-coumarate--CoA ligase 1-like [Vespula maculifrons]|uniref:4-coumarate--CoA ligase 1-like n=1 Tax=Vespula maculifrons TaxID=7453 RepID=A0ABD2CRV7_VESMC
MSRIRKKTCFAPFFVIFCVGAIFTPWNSTMDIREACSFLKLSSAKIVFADENSVNTILKVVKLDNNNIKVVVFGRAPNALPFRIYLKVISSPMWTIFNARPSIAFTIQMDFSIRLVQLAFLKELKSLISFWMSGVLLTLNSIVNYYSRLLYPTFEEEMAYKIIEKYKVNPNDIM